MQLSQPPPVPRPNLDVVALKREPVLSEDSGTKTDAPGAGVICKEFEGYDVGEL
jgi:hypothetical protein